jgi:hypothetical protein
MMNTLDLLTQVQAYLKTRVDVSVEFFPERPNDYRLNHPKGAILISYGGTRFDESRDITLMRQQASVNFSLTVMLRQLNGKTGALSELDKLRQLMVGFKPNNYRKCRLLADRFVSETDGIWQYVLDIQTQSLVVENQGEEQRITHITMEAL